MFVRKRKVAGLTWTTQSTVRAHRPWGRPLYSWTSCTEGELYTLYNTAVLPRLRVKVCTL